MSLFNRRSALLLLLPGLAACTFSPAYAPGGVAADLQGTVRVDDPDTKPGFDLVERLEERLGRGTNPRYRLGYSITTKAEGVGITPENAITRFHLTGAVDFTLTDMEGAVMTSGRVQSFTAYSATGSTVAGLAAEEDASLRLMRILADLLVSRLLASAGQWSAT